MEYASSPDEQPADNTRRSPGRLDTDTCGTTCSTSKSK